MKWIQKITSPGEYIVAFKNMANGMSGFRHIAIANDGTWVEPSDEQQLVCFGRHMHVLGYAKLTFPKSK